MGDLFQKWGGGLPDALKPPLLHVSLRVPFFKRNSDTVWVDRPCQFIHVHAECPFVYHDSADKNVFMYTQRK